MKPRGKQSEHVARVAGEPTRAALLNLPCGNGKTPIALFVADEIDAQTVLVVAPLNTKDGWLNHAKEILPDHPVVVIDSGHKDGFELLRTKAKGFYFITKDYFALSGTSLPVKIREGLPPTKGRTQVFNWKRVAPDLLVFDESHLGTNRATAVFKVLVQPKAKFKLAMSATPAGNRFDGLWETTRWLWPDHIDRSKQRWVVQWCATEYNPHNYSKIKVVGERNPGAFVASLPCYVTDEPVGKVPVKVINVTTPLTVSQRAQYDKMKRDAFIWIEENPLVAEFPMVKKIRLRQIALGEVTFNADDEVDFADDCKSVKIDACQQIIKRHPNEPILFLTDSKRFAKVLAKRIGGVAWTSDLAPAKRPLVKAEFGKSVPFIVAVIDAFGTGTDGVQERCNIEVWLNRSFNGVNNEQCEGRLNRQGQKADHVVRYNLTAPKSGDTLDFDRFVKQRRVLNASL